MKIYCNEAYSWIENLNDKYPAYDLLEYSKYNDAIALITSRGCPYSCSFCSVQFSMGQKFRIRSAENVAEEIEKYYSLGIRNFNIEDDNFSFDMGRALKIFEILIQKNIHANFYMLNGIIARNVTAKSMHIFAQAGVKKLFFGLETISKERLQKIQKGHTSLEIVKNAVRLAEQYHVQAGVSLIIGFPGQSLEELLDEIKELIRSNIPILAINPLYPVPETQMYKDCISAGILTGKEDFIMLGGDIFPVYNEKLSREDLYYVWIAIRALSKWSVEESHYLMLENIQVIECLNLIASKIKNCIVTNSKMKYEIHVPCCQLYNQIYSAGHKILNDMITAMVCIYTGVFVVSTCYEGRENVVFYIQK